MSDNLTVTAVADFDTAVDGFEQSYQQLKVQIHEELVEQLDLTKISELEEVKDDIRQMAQNASESRAQSLSAADRKRMVADLLDEIFGLGPIEKLVQDSEISDILVNAANTVYIERKGRLELTNVVFADDDHLLRIIKRVVGRVGRRIDESSPMVDARLPDGSRVNAIVPPLALDGPTISIRKFGACPLTMDGLIENGSILPEMARFIAGAIEARASVLISGGTGAGKTTLLNALSAFIPADERLVTIEDSAELILQHRHCIRLETRPANTEQAGNVSQRDLVRNALRMRPDRILVGEVRGPEVWDMLQAMNTGHEGSLTTVHANTAQDALARLEMMVAMTGAELPTDVLRKYMASAITLVVHLSRLKGGPRRVMEVAEIVGVKDGELELSRIFGFEQKGVDESGVAYGEFFGTGALPHCLDRLRAAGVRLPAEMFEQRRVPE